MAHDSLQLVPGLCIYIPLEWKVRKHPQKRWFRDGHMIFVFLLTGLWHGVTINFLVWGAWHGIGLVAPIALERMAHTKITQSHFSCKMELAARWRAYFDNFSLYCPWLDLVCIAQLDPSVAHIPSDLWRIR